MSDHPAFRPRPRQLVLWLLIGAVLLNGGCDGQDPVGTASRDRDPEPFVSGPAIISNPVAAGGPAPVSALVAPVTYVSLPSGSFAGGILASIRSTRDGSVTTTGMITGGFDPVAVVAVVGDTLEFTITVVGRAPVQFVSRVPATQPPVIVRTDPPPARRDVPLNTRIMMVFSEPVDPATVSSSSIKLSRAGSEVTGQVTLAADGLYATFQPDATLLDTTTYTLAVTTAVTDRDGDLLAAPFTLVFQTGTVPQPPLPLPSGVLLFTDVTAGISLMTADGTFYRSLTSGTSIFDVEGDWSPDGSRIAFTRLSGGYDAEINVVNADGTNQVRISPAGGYDAHPTWSPDGTRIVFEHRPDSLGENDLYVMNADGTNRVRLTNDVQPVATPAWSPDGRIAFTTYGDSGFGNIYIIDADGSNRVALMNDSPNDREPAWSPDGSRLAFQRQVAGGTDIFIINADGTNLTRLTTTLLAAHPSWSREGLDIVFTTYSECEWPETCPGPSLWVVRVSDGQLRKLPTFQPFALYPSWRP